MIFVFSGVSVFFLLKKTNPSFDKKKY